MSIHYLHIFLYKFNLKTTRGYSVSFFNIQPMSAFRRFAPISSRGPILNGPKLAGTKPWLYGQSLISTGCKDLDNALGSGLPLGSIVMLSEELYCSQMKTFQKMFISEGARSKQRILIVSSASNDEVDDFLTKLPALKEVPKSTKSETPNSAFKSLGSSSSFKPILPLSKSTFPTFL